jgi:predicted permease
MMISTFGAWRDGLALDFKLALRMLARYPLLTIVGGAGMAFGLAAGIGGYELRSQAIDPRLPLDEGHRIVGLRNRDVRADRNEPSSESDFTAWREQLRKVGELGATALVERNLEVDGNVEPIDVAEMTASGFRIARVASLIGRTIVDGDEAPGAPPVAVIGYSLWQRRFRGDPQVVDRSVRLGGEQTTIVGVMPDGFGFPLSHEIWSPLRRQMSTATRDAATLLVFGRLAEGVTRSEAQAELSTVGRRLAADAPDARVSLQPEVVPYSYLFIDPRPYSVGLALANLFLIMLAATVFANVSLLIFARAVSRENEIGVRNALGASRRRIVVQLFVEAIALSAVSVIAGLVAARYVLGSLFRLHQAETGRALPFWLNDSLAPSTIVYGVGLTMLGAVIIGVFPALKVTSGGLHARLRQFAAGGGGYRFGGVWTTVIVVQVAITVMFPAAAFFFHRWVVAGQTRDVGLPVQEYLSARLALDPTNAPAGADARALATIEELRRRLLAEPGVTAVVVGDRLPGMTHPRGRFEVEGDDAPPTYGYPVAIASVDTDFFDAVGAAMLSGRAFTATDVATRRDVAIVNASFVDRALHGRSAVGRRIRVPALNNEQRPGPWIDIVGVVRDLGLAGADEVGLYRPLTDYSSVRVAVRVGGAPQAFANRLRAIASNVEPGLRVHDVTPLDGVGADQWVESQYMSRLLAILSGIALLLSLMAIYAVMSFTVVQRTREIGTRMALGGDRRRVVVAIARRPLMQIGLGITAGGTLVAVAFVGMVASTPTPLEAGMIAAYAALMTTVCLSACIVPVRRALRLELSQVLRADG